MLKQVQETWNGHFGQINTATHRVELSLPEPKPVHTVSYRAGLKAQEADQEEVDKTLEMKVSYPGTTKRDLITLFVKKGRNIKILRTLSQTKHHNHQEFLHFTGDGLLYWLSSS